MAARFSTAVHKFPQSSPEIYIVLDDSDDEPCAQLPAAPTATATATTSTSSSSNKRALGDEPDPQANREPKRLKEDQDPIAQCKQQLEEFFKTCRRLAKSEDDRVLLTRTEDKFAKRCELLPNPAEFAGLVASIEEKVSQDPDNVFVFVNEVVSEMKAWKGRDKNRSNGQHSSDGDGQGAEGASTGPKAPLPASRKHVKKLEKLLRDLSRRIKEMEEEENTLEDLDNEESTYIQLDRYKKRYMQVWKKLCDIAGRSHSTGRAVDRRFSYQGTRYSEINRQVEHLVRRRKMCLPDYNDVLNMVSSTNQESMLRLNSREVANTAQDVFVDIGRELKKRRQTDDYNVLGCHLTEDLPEDPAANDDNLRAVLDLNFKEGCKRIDTLLEEYTQKQLELGPQVEDQTGEAQVSQEQTTDAPTLVRLKEETEEQPQLTNLDNEVPFTYRIGLTTRFEFGSLTMESWTKREADWPSRDKTQDMDLRSGTKPRLTSDSDDEDVIVLD